MANVERSTAATWPSKRPRVRVSLDRLWPYLLLSPFILIFTLFFIAPVVLGGWESLFRDGMISGRIFVGIDNYFRVFGDERFWGGMGRVMMFGAVFIPLTITIALSFALALDSGMVKGAALFRFMFFLPFIIPGVVAAVLWGFLYGELFGPINQVLGFFSLGPVDFLSKQTILPSIGNINLWLYVGYDMIIFFAALQAIPREHSEAALLDGATRWQTAWRIKAPQIKPILSIVVIFSLIGTLQLFTEPQVLKASAPDVIGRDFVPNLYAYSLASTGQQFNYVLAMAFVLGGIVLVLAAIYALIVRRGRGS